MIALERALDGSLTDRNLEALMRLVLDTGGVTAGVRWGIAQPAFTASALSADLTVNHGLGRAPVVVLASAQDRSAKAGAFNYTASNFTMRAKYDSVITGTIDVCWIAIG